MNKETVYLYVYKNVFINLNEKTKELVENRPQKNAHRHKKKTMAQLNNNIH